MLRDWKIVTFLVLTITLCVFGQDSNNYRLPTTIIPSHYDIELTPYFQNETVGNKLEFTFDGLARITIRTTLNNVNSIVLHSNKLTILNSTLTQGSQITDLSPIYTELTNKLTFNLQTALTPNVDYILSFIFIGILDTDMYGFYRSNYVENGTVKWLGTTQMQPTHARRVFPCFDEPSFKATFNIIINRPANFQPSYSNTVLLSSTLVSGRYREIFERTPKMSTYLLAFIVSEFAIRETVDKSFGVISRPDAMNQTLYAFEVGQSLLIKFDEWTQNNYSSVPEMKKMHQAALPDFSAGAMENWGLLTYRETALLYAPLTSTYLAQQRVASVIAHEISHMWFGDLVTCDWWSYTWLNEGFARYFQYFGTAMVENTWDLDLQFIVEQLQVVFVMDSLESTHPMSHDVNTPAEISGIFDNISYNKGAVILRMIEHIMRSTNFQTAVRAYIVANAYGTSTPEKLYASLQLQAQQQFNVTEFLNTWTTQSGYPVVTVERHADRRTVTVHQERFLLKNSNHSDLTKWEIHLNYASPSNNKFTDTNTVQVLSSQNSSITFQLDQESDWAVFNILQTGYYRVNYDAATWENLANALKAANHSNIHVINRAQIVDDALNLARAGYLNYTIALNILQYLEKEENYIPWLAALNNLQYLTRRFNDSVTEEYKKFFINLSKNVYDKLGFVEEETDSRIDIYNRLNILNYNCKYGNEDCIQLAKAEFVKIQNETSPVPVNIRPCVYCTAVTNGNYIEYHLLFLKYLDENVAAEQIVLLNAMGCTRFESTLIEYMNFILSDDVRLQDKATAFTATFNERIENVPFVLDFVIENHARITTAFGSINSIQTILSNLAARFSTQEQITKLQTFYNSNVALFGTSQTIPNAIDDANFNLLWSAKNIPEIYEFLKLANSSSKSVQNILLIGFISVFVWLGNLI